MLTLASSAAQDFFIKTMAAIAHLQHEYLHQHIRDMLEAQSSSDLCGLLKRTFTPLHSLLSPFHRIDILKSKLSC